MFQLFLIKYICPCRAGVQQAECASCKPKRPNPEKKIYTERTIELGLVTDVFLWDKMKVRITL
jgi:hypothetical protein